jgi:solute carrier family 25 carnitine/acylcarnitine transporter 20/29
MESGNFYQEFIAGNMGGLVGITVVYPLDTAKVRLQVYPQYRSALQVIQHMVKQDGVKSLYRGLLSPATGFGLTFAISFSAYGQGCRSIAEIRGVKRDKLGYSDLFLAGAYTGVIQSPARQVVERIKSVMQIREAQGGKSPYSWSGACVSDLVRKEGIRNGLFQGFHSVLLREIPQFAIYYPAYEYFKSLYSQYMDPLKAQFLAGGTAGTIQWLPPIYCIDVIKSRMQTAPQGYYKGLADCATKMYAESGMSVFFR